jgi:tetratricopeptide (TPR) repeat protein
MDGASHRGAEDFNIMNNLAVLYRKQKKFDQAEALYIKAQEVARRLGNEKYATAVVMPNLASLYINQGKLTEAEPLLVKALDLRSRVEGAESPGLLIPMYNLASLYAKQGQLSKAEQVFIKALEIHRKQMAQNQPGLPDAKLISTAVELGMTYEQAGQVAKSESLYREVLETIRQRGKEASSGSIDLEICLGANLLKQQRYAEAEPLLRECLKLREQNEPDDWTTFTTMSLLGASLLGQKKYDEAEPLLLAGYEGMKQREAKIEPISKVRLTEAIERLVQFYEATGKTDQADEWRARLPVTNSAKSAESKKD